MAVHIRLKQFDGPLDLLLHLIGKAKIDLKDVFVSEITEQYIEAVQSAPDFDMDEASEFVAMAALLLEQSAAQAPQGGRGGSGAAAFAAPDRLQAVQGNGSAHGGV